VSLGFRKAGMEEINFLVNHPQHTELRRFTAPTGTSNSGTDQSAWS